MLNFRWMRVGTSLCGCLLLGVLIAVQWAAFSEEGSVVKLKSFFQRPLPCGAHRGGVAMWPENTAYAYKSAAAQWPDVLLEGDVQLTSDKRVVVLHDDTVDRTTNGTGRIGDLTLEQVKALDAGYRFTPDGGNTFPYRGKGITIPLFAEALSAVPAGRFLMEMKNQPGIAEATVSVLREANALDRVVLASLNPELMRQARQLEPRVLACYDALNGMDMLARLRGGEWPAYQPVADMLAVGTDTVASVDLKAEEIRAVRDKGICVVVFTVNNPDLMRRYIDMGFSSILTDKPQLLQEILAQQKAATR